jgi:anti-anti-sigma regulatory factor
MDNVDFIDSIGVVFLLRMRELIEGNGGFFAMYNLKEGVERVLRRLRLEKILHVFKSAEECFASMLSDELKFEESALIEIDVERKLVKMTAVGR